MATEKQFEVDGVQFRFVGTAMGKEEIYAQDKVLSSVHSLFGGTHHFDYDGHRYEVKVQAGLSGTTFHVVKDGMKKDVAGEATSPLTNAICGWPFAAAVVVAAIVGMSGGALGFTIRGAILGGVAGAATGINFAIYKGRLPVALKIVFNLVCGIASAGILFLVLRALGSGR